MIRFESYQDYLEIIIYLWIPLLLILVFWSRSKHVKKLQSLGDISLIERLSHSISPAKRRIKMILRIVGFTMLIVAITGPKFSDELREVRREGVDIVILLDVSNSMLAQDIKPSRLEKARYEIRRLLDRLQGDRIALVVFAGQAHLQTPLTLDYSAFEMFLNISDETLIGVQGTSLEAAINTGIDAFDKGEKKHRAMILISDGEDHQGKIDEVLERAISENVVIHTAGVGTFSGTPIPVFNEEGKIQGYRKTPEGEIVTTRLSTETLQKIAMETKGRFVHLNTGTASLEDIYRDILGMDKKEFTRHEYTNFREQYSWFALLAMLFFVIDFFMTDLQAKERDWEGNYIEN